MRTSESDSEPDILRCLPWRSAGHELDASAEDPCGCGCDGCLEVLGEAAVAVQPGERSLDGPSAGQEVKALCGVGSLDDLDCLIAGRASAPLSFSQVSVRIWRFLPLTFLPAS